MSSDSSQRSPLIRFLDGFLQERNIKWMLGIGLMILFGSSLMLVVSEWQSYTPIWKFLILLGYTAIVFVGGDVSYRRLGLRRTGTVLQALTVLLLPITFYALRWVQIDDGFSFASLGRHSLLTALFVVDLLFAGLVSRRIFHHFLSGSQTTFVVSYLALCAAGAIAPLLPSDPAIWSHLSAFVIWALFAIGTIKVNRHVFWLTEQHRLPRIFGFFPIALLGTQFLTIFTLNFAKQIELQWLGLACALVAVPVLLTADAVTRVFQQRTGDLVRPWPWSMVLPLLVGVGLSAAGLCLSATSFPNAYALVPTAALVAVCMAAIARRTRSIPYVWGMLFCVLLAYNFSPVFFVQFAKMVVQQGATAVHEDRLPLAFYGLTYLPLLAGLMASYVWLVKAGANLFARPIQLFTMGLSCLLLVLSAGHAKAVFPVAAVMTLVFAVEAVMFRDRRLLIPALLSSIAATFGLNTFIEQVWQLPVPQDFRYLSLAALSGLLLWPGRLIDRWSLSIPFSGSQSTDRRSRSSLESSICRLTSLLLTSGVGLFWIQHSLTDLHGSMTWLPAILLCGLFFLQAIVWLKPGLGEVSILFAAANGVIWSASRGMDALQIVELFTVVTVLLWFAATALKTRPQWRLSRAFAHPACHASLVAMWLLSIVCWLPAFVLTTVGFGRLDMLIYGAPAVIWAFDAARQRHSSAAAVLGCLGLLGLVGSVMTLALGAPASWEWLPCAWAATALVGVPFSIVSQRRLRRRDIEMDLAAPHSRLDALRAIAIPVNWVVLCVLSLTALMSLVVFTPPYQIAGLVALCGLLSLGIWGRHATIRSLSCILINWQLISWLFPLFAPNVTSVLGMSSQQLAQCSNSLGLMAAISLIGFQMARRWTDGVQEVHVVTHLYLLRLLAVCSLGASLLLLPVGVSEFQAGMATVTFGLLAGNEFWMACRKQQQERVWFAEAIVAAAVAYLLLFGVISMGNGFSLYALFASGLVAWIAGSLSTGRSQTKVLSVPLMQTGMALPAVAVVTGVLRHVAISQPQWLGMNSLALLLAAGFYFWRGLEGRQKSLVVAAAVIVNVALAMLWRELQWWDPQFFMIPLGLSVLLLVECMKDEIPARFHDPLRYIGALTILVSPTFHIVGGSWLHIFSLLAASVVVTLLSIGLRIRVVMYTGTAFLIAGLLAMVVRGGVDNPNILWIAGIALGAAVIVLAAFCENHREKLLSRLRVLASELETWQ